MPRSIASIVVTFIVAASAAGCAHTAARPSGAYVLSRQADRVRVQPPTEAPSLQLDKIAKNRRDYATYTTRGE